MADGFAVLAFLRLLLPPPPQKTERGRANEREMEEDRSALLLSSRLLDAAAAACEEMDSDRVRVGVTRLPAGIPYLQLSIDEFSSPMRVRAHCPYGFVEDTSNLGTLEIALSSQQIPNSHIPFLLSASSGRRSSLAPHCKAEIFAKGLRYFTTRPSLNSDLGRRRMGRP